jgi:2-phospho-L-lactate guanylyltransferase
LLTAESVGVVLEGAAPPPSVVIAPDHSGRGTNVLLMTPPRLFPFCFGPNSFRRHLAQAKRHGASIAVVRRAELAADVDTPGDLSFLGPRGKNERPS